MDLNIGAEYEGFRAEVSGFLAKSWKSELLGNKDAQDAFRREATARGYLYRAIPRRFGGSEQSPDPIRARIIREEFARVRAPGEVTGPGMGMLLPTLLAVGEEWQKEQFIPRIISGDMKWCQGYSEPGSGSDLASLRTRAVLEGNEWVITGQKVWTSYAHEADYMFILVRTDPDAPKHKGISYLLLDMRQPGVEVRPLRQMTGGSEFNEVFLDGARTPKHWIVGKPGEGWAVSKSTLKFERDGIGSTATTEQAFRQLVKLASETRRNGRPLIARDDVRQSLAQIQGYILAQKYSTYRQSSMNLAGKHAGVIETMGKLNGTQIGHRIAALAQELAGDDAMLMPPGKRTPGRVRPNAKWVNQMIGSLGIAIAGGTSNIQRNVIAERGLELPREEKQA